MAKKKAESIELELKLRSEAAIKKLQQDLTKSVFYLFQSIGSLGRQSMTQDYLSTFEAEGILRQKFLQFDLRNLSKIILYLLRIQKMDNCCPKIDDRLSKPQS